MLDNKVIIDLDDYVDDIDVDLSDVVIAHSTPPLLQDKTVSPTTSQQEIMADVGYSGLNKVTINAVTSAIDNNIQPSNIKSGVSILGVVGTLESGRVDVVQTDSTIANFINSNITSYTNTTTTATDATNFFRYCESLEYAILSLNNMSGNWVFQNCYKLNYVTFTKTGGIISLGQTGVFQNAGTQNTNPNHIIYIYVPSSLVETYKTATNWSTLYNNGQVDFLPIQ